MALNRKIKEEIPHSVMDLLRETRSGNTQAAQQPVRQSARVQGSEDPLLRDVQRYNSMSDETTTAKVLNSLRGRSASPMAQQTPQEWQEMRQNLANSPYRIGGKPINYDALSNRERAQLNYWDPSHKLYNTRSSTNYEPVHRDTRLVQDENGRKKLEAGANPYVFQQGLNALDDRVLTKLMNGEYNGRPANDPEANSAVAALNRQVHGTPEYVRYAKWAAAQGADSMTPEQQAKLQQDWINSEADRRTNVLMGNIQNAGAERQRYLAEMEEGEISRLTNTDPSTRAGQRRKSLQELYDENNPQAEKLELSEDIANMPFSMGGGNKTVGQMVEESRKSQEKNWVKTITNDIRQRYNQGGNEAYIIDIGQQVMNGQRYNAAQAWNQVWEGMVRDMEIMDAALKDDPNNRDAKEAKRMLQEQMDYWELSKVMFNPDFKENSGYRPRENDTEINRDGFEVPKLHRIINGDYQQGNLYLEGYDTRWDNYMHNEQKAIYNYIYNTQGEEAADKYFEGQKKRLEYNRSNEYRASVEEKSRENPVAAAIFKVTSLPASAVTSAAAAVTGASPYSSAFAIPNARQTAGATVRDMIDQATKGNGEWYSKVLNGAATFGYDAVTSTLESMIGVSFGALASGALGLQAGSTAAHALGMMQSMEVYGNSYQNYTKRGVGETEAQILSALSGTMEFATEMVGMEWTMRGIHAGGNTRHIIACAALRGGIAEALEEAPGEAVMIAAENLLLGEESEINIAIDERTQRYMLQGDDSGKVYASEEEARRQATCEVYAEKALETLYQMGVAGISGAGQAGYQAAVDISGRAYANRVQQAVQSGDISEQQAQTIIEANRNAAEAAHANNDALLNPELQEQAKEATQQWNQNAMMRELTGANAEEIYEDVAGRIIAEVDRNVVSEGSDGGETAAPAVDIDQLNEQANIVLQQMQEAKAAREQAQKNQSFNNAMAASQDIHRNTVPQGQTQQRPGQLSPEAQGQIRALQDEANKRREAATKSFNNSMKLKTQIDEVMAEIRALEQAQDEGPVIMQRGQTVNLNELASRGTNNSGRVAELHRQLGTLNQQYFEEVQKGQQAQQEAQDMEVQAQRLTDENNPVAEMRKPAPQIEQAQPVEEPAQPAMSDEEYKALEDRYNELQQKIQTAKEQTKTPAAENEGLKSRKRPNVSEKELARWMMARDGRISLDEQEKTELDEKVGNLQYYFEKKPFGADVKIEGKDVKIDGFESTGTDAKVTINETGENGETVKRTVPLEDVDFGEHIGIQSVYEHAAAYSDVNTAKNFLAGYEASAVDPVNYARGFEGVYSSALSGKEMTASQAVSASMLEPGVKSMIQKAAQRARSQMAEELGIDGETNSDMTKAEQGIARAGTEQANSRTYTGVVRDFSGKMNAKQRANMHALHWIAKNAGMKITLTDKAGRYLTRKGSIDENAGLNGFFRTGTNEAVIDIHAMDGAAVITAFHEAWHFVKQEAKNSPELAENVSKIEGILEKHLNSLPNYNRAQRIQEVQALYKNAGQSLTEDEALEEIYADALRGVADRGLITQFKNATGTQTVLDKIRSVLEKWKGYLNKAVRSLGESNAEVRAVLQADEDTLAKLSNGFRMTREAAGRVYAERTAGQETVEETGERFAIRENYDQATIDFLGQYPSTSITFKNISEYTSDELENIKGYLKAVDTRIVEYYNKIIKTKNQNAAPLKLGSIPQRAIKAILEDTGRDVSDYKIEFRASQAIHINRRHGPNGQQDHTMKDPNDVARFMYVLENYTGHELDDENSTAYRESIQGTRLSKGAPQVDFYMKLNGTYVTVQAIPDSKAKTIGIITSFEDKNEGGRGSANAAMLPSPHTSKTSSAISSNNDYTQSEEKVKEKSGETKQPTQKGSEWENKVNSSTEAAETGTQVDVGTQSAYTDMRLSLRTYNESEYVTNREKMISMIMQATGKDSETVGKWFDDVNGIAAMIAADKTRLDYMGLRNAAGELVNSALKSNAEYGGSIDMSLICAKRRLMTGTIDAIQRRLGNSGFLTAEEMMKVRQMLLKHKYQAACGLCYVESSRKNMGKIMNEFRREFQAAHQNDGTYIPSMADINTVEGLADLQIHHPDVYEALVKHMNKMAQRKPKMYEMRTEYNGEILKRFANDDTVGAKNEAGGLRINSFSDFEIVHLIDMMQVIMDMSAVGLAGQAYTKVPDFAKALGATGLKINLSLIAKRVGKGGRIVFDDVEGMDHKEAFKIREQYSDNVGTILVVFTEQQLRAAVNDPRIDFIIPFHRSQWKKADYQNLGLAKDTMDFTMHQNERWIHPSRHLNQNGKKTRPANFAPNSYWDFSKTGKENAEAYLRKCAEDDRQPKFAKFLVNNGDGSWSLPADGSMDGYWKLLIDFKMYNNEGEGRPQMPVQPNFNTEESERMLKEYKGGHESFPVANDVVDEFLKDREKTFGVKYSLADVEEAAEKAFPNSKVRDADGKLMKMYHGTGAEFTEFKRDRIGSTGRFEGSGFNFTPYEGRASSYGKNVLAGYLNIEKPLSAEKKTISLAKLAKIIREADPTGDNIIADYARETRDYGKPSFVQRESLTAARSIWDSSDNDVDIYSFISSADSDAESLIAKFEELGYDGLIHYDDNGNIKTAVAFSSHQFKLADEVTRDDNGKEIPLSERFNTKNEDIRFSLADRQYKDAVKNGDTELADLMVERAAKRAGYTLKVTHRTNANFNVFDKTKRSGKNGKSLGDGFYVAELKDGRRSEYDSDAYGKIRIVAYVDPGNVFNLAKGLSEEQAEYVYDKYFAPFHEDRFGTYKPHVIDKLQSSTRLMDYIIEAAETNNTTTDEIFKDLGYDSIKDGPQYAIFDSEQIKRADTATYDDDGELIPLSERFNRENPDIRYSLSDPAVEDAADGIRWSFGTELTDEDGNSEMAQLLNENERLQAENQRLRDGVETAGALNESRQMRELMQQVTTQINQWRSQDGPDAKQIAKMARDVREALETTVPYEDLKQDLTSVFQSMSKAKTPTEAKAAMQALSDLMLHCAYNSRHADKSDYEQYADERTTIKGVSPRAWKEVCADVGMEWDYFRRKWGPKLGWIKNRRTLRDDGASIDSAWQELNEMNPGTFSDDTLALGDKAAAMLAFMDQTAIHYYNPHTEENPMNQGVDTATYAASDMAMKLLYDYMTNGHEVQGSDQRRMARITELMDQTMTAIRENRGRSETPAPVSWQKKMDEMKQRIRQERSAGFQRAREARADERARQQDIRMRQAERRAEMEDRRKTIGEINRKRASLLKKLEHPSSSGWVPTAMRDSVTKLLTALDFENEITGEQAFTEDLLKEAKAAYESINKGEGPDGARGPMASYYNGDLVNTFDKLIETAAGKKASQLTDEEMSEIRDIVSGFAAAVINADTMFTSARSESLHDMGDTMIDQSNERRRRLGEHKVQGKLGQWMSTALSRGLLKPTTVYSEYEGTVIGDIYKRLRAAEFQHIRNVTEAEQFFQDLINKYNMQSVVNQESSEGRSRHLDRIRRQSKSFRLSSGQTVNLTIQELMTLYAWQKREGMMETNHLLGGGFTLRNQAKGGSTAEYRVNSGDLAQFNAALTDDQKKFVDEMVKYLSTTVGSWGNEVTEILYGLSKFTESYYLPFTVNKNYVGQDPAQAQDARIKVASFTKDLTRNASTTLELAPFMTLWASHVEQMSDFNAFTLPIEDMVRVMNYRQSLYDDEGKFAGYGESVRPRMQQAWGRNSTDYIYSFLARLNGNSRQEHGGSWINRFMGTAKGAAVTFNLSVAAQQMGAGIRAMAEMNPIDVAKGIVKGLNVVRINKQYEELMQYAPIAIEKSWGYFDTNMKSGLYDRQRKTAWNWIEDKGGKLAEFGDMFNWVQIWQACKSEARRLNKGASDETIKQKAGERFADVIDRTQVVDSVFQRAEWATEKGMMKNLMAFMSEPITMYNMLYRSATDFGRAIKTKQGAGKAFGKLTRNVAAIGMSGALTALLKSLITGLRNRDNEKKDKDGNIIGRKTYWDKVQESWGENMLDNLMGVGTVFSSAIQDVAGSYRSSNSLTDAWIGNLYDAGKELVKVFDGNSEPNYEKAFYKALQGVSSLCGVGFASLYRDSKALIDTAKEEFSDMVVAADAYDDSKSLEERLSVATQTMAYTDDHKGPGMKKKPGYYTDLLLDVYLKHGLGAEFEQVADAAISVGATEKGLQTSFKTKLREVEDRIPAAAKALVDGDTETYNRLVHELLDAGIGSKAINSMIQTEYNKLVTNDEPKTSGTGEGVIGGLEEELDDASILTTRARSLLTENATDAEIKEAISLFEEDGEDKISGEFSSKYKKLYVEARQGNDKEKVKGLERILLTKGTGIDREMLDKWVKDDYSSKGLDILKNTNTAADAAQAIKVYQQGGIDQDGIKSRFSGQFKKPYVEACMNGNKAEAKRLQEILLTRGTGIDQKTLDNWVKDGYNDEAAKLLTDKATESDIAKAISIYQKGGFTEKEITGKISDKYKKAYVQACVNGNTSEAARLQRLCLTRGTGISSADVKEWTGKDLFGTQKDTGLYWQIMNGNTDDAKKTCQWLYRNFTGGQKAVKEKILNWAKTRKKNGTDTDWSTVKTVLLALGFSASTIRSTIGI